MLRLLSAFLLLGASAPAYAQTSGTQNNTLNCGGTTGTVCPSFSPTSTESALPCCDDPARCLSGQKLCSTPSPSITAMPTRLTCCPPGASCAATLPACSPLPSAFPTPFDSSQGCCDTADCPPDQPICSPLPTPYPTRQVCPEGTFATSTGECIRLTPPPSPFPTRPLCPEGTYATSTGECIRITQPPTPFPTKQVCPEGTYATSTGECIRITQPPTPFPTRPVCPEGTYATSTGECIRITQPPTPFPTRPVCPEGTFPNAAGSCVRSTELPTPFPTRRVCPPETMMTSSGECITITKQPCPAGFFLSPDGGCMPQNPGNMTQPCPTGFYMTSDGVCVEIPTKPVCPTGTFMTPTGACVSFDLMCNKEMAGTRFNPETQQCECPPDQWIIRNRTALTREYFAMCAPAPSTLTFPPRIACSSFISNTMYVPDLETCICSRDFPVIVPNPNDQLLPFRCAPSGTETSIPPCELPTFFDFLERRCVLPDFHGNSTDAGAPDQSPKPTPLVGPSKPMTPRPTPILAPSQPMTPRPSRLPNPSAPPTPLPTRVYMRSAYPTRSAPPTDHPTPRPTRDVDMTPSSTRTPRPAEAIWADVSRPPLPSVDAKPPSIDIPRLPVPSPWVPQRNITLESWEMPPRIDSSIKLPGADSTTVDRPETIQQFQASLACSLRLPLEKIRITNITILLASGTIRPILLDPSQYALTSNGNVECLAIMNDTTPARRRRLQGSEETIVVDYAVMDPPVEIVALTSSELTSILSESPTMNNVAASVGSNGIVVTTESTAASGPTPAPVTPPASSSVTDSIPPAAYAGIGAAGALVVGLVAAVIVKNLRKNVNAAHPPQIRPTRVVQLVPQQQPQAAVVYMNPVALPRSNRVLFTPRGVGSLV